MKTELYDLTNPQKSIWLTEQFFKGSTINNICGTVLIDEVVNLEILSKAINIFIKDNDSFRLKLLLDSKGAVKQYISDYVEETFPIHSLSSDADLLNLEIETATKHFDIIENKLYDFELFNLSSRKSGFVLTANHLICDACTSSLIASKIINIYSSLIKNQQVSEPSTSYINYINSEEEYLNSAKFQKDKQYWDEQFDTIPEFGTIPSTKELTIDSTSASRQLFSMDSSLVDNINTFCKNNKLSLFNFFMAVYAIYIGKVSNLNEFVLGTPILNRTTFIEKNTPGMFISTVPFKFSFADSQSFVEFAQKVAMDSLSMFRHQKYPYQNILEHIRKTNPSQPNLYDILISYQNSKTNRNLVEIPYSVRWTFNNNVADSMQIHLFDMNDEGILNIAYDYRLNKYSKEDIINIHNRILYVVEQILNNSNCNISNLEIITPDEKNKILNVFNNTCENYDLPENILTMIEKYAKFSPDKIAIETADDHITYSNLIFRVNQLSNYLLSKNIPEKSNIGILTSRTIDTMVAILATMKINCTYVPIDPEYPSERISYMIDTSGIKYLLLTKDLDNIENNLTKIYIDYSFYQNELNVVNKSFNYNKNNNLYIIFTSGSTGKPKGVTISHKNMMNLICFEKYKTNLLNGENIRILQFATMSFDVSYQEIFSALIFGNSLVLIDDTTRKNMNKLLEYILNKNINTLFIPPAYLKLLVEDSSIVSALSKVIKNIITAGEALVITPGIKDLISAGVSVHNHYGPAETHVATTFTVNSTNITVKPPVGKPISNTKVYVLDSHNQLCPIGITGQIAISGDCVGNGYWNNLSLTNEKFITDPYTNKKMYLTGDLGYFDNFGNICYIGRSDFQVKINGFRIELQEIDQIMIKHPLIKSSISVVQEVHEKKYIVTYYTAKKEISTAELTEYTKKYLPFYMLPKKMVMMENLPITNNGKIDRKQLPKVDFNIIEEAYEKPETATEKKLATIWKNLFNINKVNINSNFFDIGGDSLLAIKLCTMVFSSFNIDINISHIFANPTLKALAKYLDSCEEVSSVVIPKAPEMDSYPLSSAQRRIYYACKSISEKNVVYNIPSAFIVDTILDEEKTLQAFQELINANSSLRTCFRLIDNEPRQVILDNVDFSIECSNLAEAEISNVISDFSKPFNLENASLFRVSLYHIDNGKTLLLLDSHHIIMDGVSLNILMSDFCKIYQNENIETNNLEYKDYSMWENTFLNSEIAEKYENYWLNNFKDEEIPVINLPYDKPITQSRSFTGKLVYKNISKELFAKLELLAKKYGVSSYMLFLSAFYVLLYEYTSQNRFIVGSPIAGRDNKETQNLIGMFVNIIPLKLDISAEQTFVNLLMSVKDLVLKSLENQPYPYDQILKKLDIPSNSSFMDVVFTYQNILTESMQISDHNMEMIYSNTNTSKYNLSVGIIPNTNTFYAEYNSNLFYEESISNFLEHYIFVLEQILDNENVIIRNIPKTTPREEKLIREFNSTDGEINSDTVVSIFEQEVKKHPNDIALICDDKTLTYNELNQRTNSLAHLLVSKGIGSNDIVCIMTNRSLETIVCMLAILKSGAAFFNVDPTYPIDRTQYYIETSKTKFVLTQRELKDKVSTIENCIEIDLDNKQIYGKNAENLDVKINMQDLSYLIFTSGSTGKPKGVMLNQVGFANMAKAMTLVLDYLKEGNKHTLVSVTSTPFDIFVYEIIVSLTHGLKVVMANNAQHRNPKLLDALIRKYNVDVMTVTPSLMKINYDNREPDSALALVKNMVFGGEPLPEKFVADLRALADDITIYNIYGPSEITILSNVQNITGEKEITVGPPILNTQMYILDNNMKQVPIGVVGEIYIAGIQVGLGYIGNQELTNEKFLNNPFGPGKMYKSGDIGRWTFDGKIQCLGRVDNQVKLRGLRIELGEIEAQMAKVKGVSATVVNKIEIDNKEVLCGYYVATEKVRESSIREHLKKTLPPYMVPAYIVRLDNMPYTLNRKIDRKALPMPNLVADKRTPKIDIQTLGTDEKKLVQIWKNILNLDTISIDDNFFDLGGDSVSAINMQIEALKYGLNFEYADIFNHPTIRELCNNIQSPIVSFYDAESYNEINKILSRNTVDNISTIHKFNVGNILLIGSTGFLGIHILDAFLKSERGTVYCLIRPKNNFDPVTRLKQKISFYFGEKYFEKYKNRICIIQGDITQPDLGLSAENINNLTNNINAIINSGAIVKHFGQVDIFEKINVNGTHNIIELCKKMNKRLLHISTVSVSGNGEKEETVVETAENIDKKKIFKETSLFINQNIKGIYAITKYKAECMVLKAISEGLDAQILRIGNITSRYSDGLFQENVEENAFAKKIKSFIEISAFPDYLLPHSIELTPVDLCANATIKILQYNSSCNVFHIYNTKLLPIKLLVKTIEKNNIKLYPVSDQLLADIITGILNDDNRKSILSGIIHDLDKDKHLVYTSNIRLNCDFTEAYLQKIGFNWLDINEEYLLKYIKYLNKIGFINRGEN